MVSSAIPFGAALMVVSLGVAAWQDEQRSVTIAKASSSLTSP